MRPQRHIPDCPGGWRLCRPPDPVSYTHLQELQEENEQSGSIQEELDAVRLAMMTMNQISEDIYKESAAHLNQKISDILSQITEGRYTSVFLDTNMEVRINTPKKLLSLEPVSYTHLAAGRCG